MLNTNFSVITLDGKLGCDQGEAFRGLQKILGNTIFLNYKGGNTSACYVLN